MSSCTRTSKTSKRKNTTSFFKGGTQNDKVRHITLRNINPLKVELEHSQSKTESRMRTNNKNSIALKKSRTDQKSGEIAVYGTLNSKAKENTSIAEIIRSSQDPKRHQFAFYDVNKKSKKWVMTMVSTNNGQSLPDRTDIHCYWCKHQFETSPLGCPISTQEPSYVIVSNSAIYDKTSYRTRTLPEYERKAMISTRAFDELIDNGNEVIIHGSNKKFVTDGVFCSFNCVKAYIMDNHNDRMYEYSNHLLNLLYKYCTGSYYNGRIIPAPSWRLLKSFGGHLTIQEFRKSFDIVEFIDTCNKCLPMGKIFAEKIIF